MDKIRAKYQETFTLPEKETVEICIQNNDYNGVVAALFSRNGTEFTPEKEEVLNNYLELRKPVDLGEESEVRKALREEEFKGNRIETPEQEKEWQEKLDAEAAALKAKKEAEMLATEEVAPVSESNVPVASESTEDIPNEPGTEDVTDPNEMTMKEIKEKLDEKGVKYASNLSKAELVDVYNQSLSETTDALSVETPAEETPIVE